MQITTRSEWMKASKHADVMGPSGTFEVIQTASEKSIFFSLGTDQVFYATMEQQETSTGWNRLDLSSGLSSKFGGSKVVAKVFAISQNNKTGQFDVALAVTANGGDHLFMSQGNKNDEKAWTTGIPWTEFGFDGDGKAAGSTKISISDIFALNVPGIGSITIVDIEREAGKNNLLDRYIVRPKEPVKWKIHQLPIESDAKTLSSVIGLRDRDRVAGMYDFGVLRNLKQLSFVNMYNPFDEKQAVNPVRLKIPNSSTAITAAANADGRTSLFVSHADGLSVFPPNAQKDGSEPVLCISNRIVAGATALSASTVGPLTSVWGKNVQNGLFYTTCKAGSETDIAAWKIPVVLETSIEQFAFYTGISTHSHTLYVHTHGQEIVELDQDPVTTDWRKRKILLPSTDVNDTIEFNSYTTRLEVVDDNKIAVPRAKLSVASISPVPVYVNDVYYVLRPEYPVTVECDGAGAMTIVQQTENLSVVAYNIAVDGSKTPMVVNPSAKATQTLQGISSGDDLSNVKVTDKNGASRSIVPDSVSSGDRNQAAAAIKSLCDIGKNMNEDGTPTSPSSTHPKARVAGPKDVDNHVFTLHVAVASSESRLTLLENDQAHPQAHLPQARRVAPSGTKSALVSIGDFFCMVANSIADTIHSIEIKVVDGLHQIFTAIGDMVYHAVLDCATAVMHAIRWVADQVKILLDDLMNWLGFIFGWKDILRTHSVVKNIVKTFTVHAIEQLPTARNTIGGYFDDVSAKINAWADLPNSSTTVGSVTKASNDSDGSKDPQSHFVLNHTKSNLNKATTNPLTSTLEPEGSTIQALAKLSQEESAAITNAMTRLKDSLVNDFGSLTPAAITKRVIAIVGDLLVKTAKNMIMTAFDLITVVTKAVIEVLDAPLHIPIISPLYKFIADAELSILDLLCLVVATPATIMYKIAKDEAPFPDNDLTRSLIKAPDFKSICNLLNPKQHTSSRLATMAVPPPQPSTQELNSDEQPMMHIHRRAATKPRRSETFKNMIFFARFISGFSSIVNVVILDINFALKNSKDDESKAIMKKLGEVNTLTSSFINIVSIVEIYPDENAPPHTVAAGCLSFFQIGKVCYDVGYPHTIPQAYKDYINPILTIYLQLGMTGPPIESFRLKHEDAVDSIELAAALTGRLGGALVPIANSTLVKSPVDYYFLGFANALIISSGVMVMADASAVVDRM